MRASIAFFIAFQLIAVPAPGSTADDPPVIDRLIGSWEGQGTLFGSDAGFSMRWERALGERFVRLTFENRVRGANGTERVLEAEAFYRAVGDGRLEGTWFDSRGMVLPLKSEAKADTLTTLWGTPETEQGRTVYQLTGDDEVQVDDYVLRENEWRQFGQATYRRSTESGEVGGVEKVGDGTVLTGRN